jgi:hypothetical protein
MRLHDAAGYVEASGHAARGTAARWIGAVEAIEDMRQVFGCNTLSAITDYDLDLGRVARRADRDITPGRGVRKRVGDQIAQYLAKAYCVDLYQWRSYEVRVVVRCMSPV